MFMETGPASDVFDNSARSYSHMEVRPHAAAMGAELVGVDVARLSDAGIAELKDALFRHKMIFLRDQQLTDDQHLEFTSRLGPVGTDPYASPTDPQRFVTPVIKEADERPPFVFGGGWHTDSAFMAQPPAITTLRAVEVPPYGGDTLWANAALAYRALSRPMREFLAGQRIHMSSKVFLGKYPDLHEVSKGYTDGATKEQALVGTSHPLIRTHPETGEKAIYISMGYAPTIEGMTEAESLNLATFLFAHITQHAFTVRLKWEEGMLALWDNRLCLHVAMNDYDGYRREMHRTMVAGESPA